VPVAEPTPPTAAGPSLRELTRRRDQILTLAARHGAANVRVFGSVARGEAGAESDIDFLVDLEQGRTWPACSSISKT
jgi:predicted nucleotidyltransferase